MRLPIAFAAALVATSAFAQAPATYSPAGWETAVDTFLEGELKDPYSAVKKVTRGPRSAAVLASAYTTWRGWAVCMSVNAKNTYGGYTGAQTHLFVVRDDKVIGHLVQDGDSSWNDGIVRRECEKPADKVD